MQTESQAIQPDPRVIEAVEALSNRRPALVPLLTAFGGLLAHKAALAERLAGSISEDAVCVDPARLVQGVPLLAGADLSALRGAMNEAVVVFLPLLAEAFPVLNIELTHVAVALDHSDQGSADVAALARHLLDGNDEALARAAEDMNVPAGVLVFALRGVLAPVLAAVDESVRVRMTGITWTKGFCPVCGSLPGLAALSKVGDLGSEFLRGGGGQKHLHCSLCGHDWRIARGMCPVCENSDKDQREYFRVEGETVEKVDICLKCGLYVPCVDLRELDGEPPLEVLSLGMAHLDILARQKGYRPAAWLPWNQID
ncbi:MAG: formate dehydrogenase accessory protein FdhE [Desulfocurvibacter africanus]